MDSCMNKGNLNVSTYICNEYKVQKNNNYLKNKYFMTL